ncbi:MAG: DUF58 domain-containing protein [Euryarchaeota archaeon]|nr:DUF58 domain-containing protein [Euryarchaeota archaeon]
MISRRASHLGVLTGILLGLGLVLGNGPLLVVGLLSGGLVAGMSSMEGPSGFRAARRIDRRHPQVGDTVTVQVQVDIKNGLGPVLVHCPLPDTFQLAGGTNVFVAWKGPGRARRHHKFQVRCAKRGAVILPSVEVSPSSPFRMRGAVAEAVTPPLELVVAPRVRRVTRVRHLRGKARTPLPAGDTARSGERSTDFMEVRDYAAGDPMRSVNWRATARRSSGDDLRLMVNEHEPEGKKAVWLFLDAGAHMEVGSTRENSLDRALEGTLGILDHFVSRGYRVGATIYHQPETRILYPDSGTRQMHRLNHTLTTLVAHSGGDRLGAAVVRSRGFLMRERPLVLLVTRPEADPAATKEGIAQIRALTGHGRRATPMLLLAPTPLVHGIEGGHHSLSVQALRLAARGTYLQLRSQGVHVLDWDPARTPLEGLLVKGVVPR